MLKISTDVAIPAAAHVRFEEINRILPTLIRQAGEAFIGGDMHGAISLARTVHTLRAERNSLEADQLKAASNMFNMQIGNKL